MSLYRQVRRPSGWITGGLLATLAAGFVLGFVIARATASEATLADGIAELQGDAAPVADALELVSIHYGADDEATRDAAGDQLARAQDGFASIEPRLRLLAPERATAARAAIERLAGLVDSRAEASQVERAAGEARAAVRAAAGLR